MKKIGIITFYKDNFGSILQCFATKKFIESLGYECTVLYEKENEFFLKVKRIPSFIKRVITDKNYLTKRKIIINKGKTLALETQKKMNTFVEEELQPKGYTFKKLKKIENNFFKFIVGSDQVWNANNHIPKSQFLLFTNNKKKIAFSVSLGTDSPGKDFKAFLKKKINGFIDISVREESGIKILKDLNKEIPIKRVADPTMMFSSHFWRKFYLPIKKERYILVHFLNEPSTLAIDTIELLKNKYKLNVISIGYKYDIVADYRWDYEDCSPYTYLSYIDKSFCVCTDSFHSTLFSINFEKPFFVFERQYLHHHPQTSRITDLLTRFDLIERFICEFNPNLKVISYTRENMLLKEMELTREYLKERLIEK